MNVEYYNKSNSIKNLLSTIIKVLIARVTIAISEDSANQVKNGVVDERYIQTVLKSCDNQNNYKYGLIFHSLIKKKRDPKKAFKC